MPDAVDNALLLLAAIPLECSIDELLASAQEELDAAARAVLRQEGDVEEPLLLIVGLLAASISGLYMGVGRAVDLDEVAEEVRDGVAIAEIETVQEVPGRILYVDLHEALVELHRRSGRFTRLEDTQSALEFVKGAAALGGRIVHAVSSGRLQLLLRPI